jgi:hypothetical protein
VEKSLDALAMDMAMVKEKIQKCDELMPKATAEQKQELEARRLKYEAQRDRLAVAIDVVGGRAYAIYDIDGKLTVIKPNSEGVAKLIRTAEDYGARATKLL